MLPDFQVAMIAGIPRGECLITSGMKLDSSVLIEVAGENVDDLIMNGKKPLPAFLRKVSTSGVFYAERITVM